MTSFHHRLEQQYQTLVCDDGLEPIRQKAWNHFQSLGLPDKHLEVWRSVKLRKLYDKILHSSHEVKISVEEVMSKILPGFEKRCLVFLNGKFNRELSSLEEIEDRVAITTLGQAQQSYGGFLSHCWIHAIKEEKDPFAVLNAALGIEGAFLYIPPKVLVKKSVQILSIQSTAAPTLIQPRIHVFAGKQARIELVSTTHVINDGNVCNGSFHFSVEEGARVSLNQLNYQMPLNHWQLESVRANLKRDSYFSAVNITNGSETVRCDYKTSLLGENGEVNLSGLSVLSENREAHTNVLVNHQAPYCRSNQLFKGILKDISRSSFEGKIYVHQRAQKTDAFQLNNNLLLSERAHAFSKPNLEIFADDVKASHGATVGQLEKEHLFYLKTRGYSHQEAQRLLVRGFYFEIIHLIKDETVQQIVLNDLQKGW